MQPAGNGHSKLQTQVTLDSDSVRAPLKQQKKSQDMAGLVMSQAITWKLPAKCSHRMQPGKDKLAKTAQQVHKDDKFKDMSSI